MKTRKLNKITGEIEPYVGIWWRLMTYLLSGSVVVLMVKLLISKFRYEQYTVHKITKFHVPDLELGLGQDWM